MIKKIFGVSIAAASALALASCGGEDVLEFRLTWGEDSGRYDAINLIVDDFNATLDDGSKKIKTIGGNEDAAQITTSDAAIKQMPYRYTVSLGQQGLFADLSDDFVGYEDNYYDSIVDLGKDGDVVYGIPWIGHTMGIIYNVDLVEEAGKTKADVEALETWADFDAFLEVIENELDGVYGIAIAGKQSNDVSWMANQFVYSFGGSVVTEDGTASNLGDPRSIAGLEYYFNTLGSHSNSAYAGWDGNDVMDEFRSQRTVFEIQGPWGVTDIWKQPTADQFEVGVIPFSQFQDDQGNIGAAEAGPHMLTISDGLSDSDYELAVDFVEYMIGKEAQEKLMDGEYDEATEQYYPFRVPLRKDMADTEFFTEHPEFLPFIDGFKNVSIDVPTPEWSTVREQSVLPNYNAIATGTKNIQTAVDEINAFAADKLA